MKVVHLNTSDFGGAAMAAIQLHQALLDQGVESDLLTLNKTRNDIQRHHRVTPFSLFTVPLVARIAYKARRLFEVSGLIRDQHNAPDNKNLIGRPERREIFTVPYSFFPIWRHPLIKDADVVHLHWVSYGMIDHRDFFRNCDKPIIWTMHDMNPFTGGCHHADECFGYQSDCPVCPQLKDHALAQHYWTYKKRGMYSVEKQNMKLVAPSKWLADKAKLSVMLGSRSIEVIPNGFDIAVFRVQDKQVAREALALPADKKIILFNALDVDNTRKGASLLNTALDQLGQNDVVLVRIGGKNGRSRADRTIDTGYIQDPATLAQYYAAADLFVLPSLAENLPNTISESLLCGTPVVAFNVGGIPEQIHENNGVRVDQQSSAGLEVAIKAALGKNWDRSSIAQQAVQRYDRRVIAKAYERLYSGTA